MAVSTGNCWVSLVHMNWLFKEEPSSYSFAQFTKDGGTTWSGVKNPLAQKHLRSVKKGDRIFYYHTGNEKAVVGVARATGDAYPDPTDKTGKAAVVDIAPGSRPRSTRDSGRNQGFQSFRHISAHPTAATVGHARLRCGVEGNRTDG